MKQLLFSIVALIVSVLGAYAQDAGAVKLTSYELGAEGGKLTFDAMVVAFADEAETLTCNVSNAKTNEVAAQATLTYDERYWDVLCVEFSKILEIGDYTLDIPAGVIVDALQDTTPYAGGKIAFTVVPTAVNNVEVAPDAKANGKYIENGKVVIVKEGVRYDITGRKI